MKDVSMSTLTLNKFLVIRMLSVLELSKECLLYFPVVLSIQPVRQELAKWNDWSMHLSHILQQFPSMTHLSLSVNETGSALYTSSIRFCNAIYFNGLTLAISKEGSNRLTDSLRGTLSFL